MNYYLKDEGKSRKIPISAEEYGTLKWAKVVLIKALDFSKHYCVVLETFELFEKVCFDISLQQITRGNYNFYRKNLRSQVKLNAAIGAYLSNARFFLDRVQPILKEIISIEDYATFREKWNSVYDNSKEYQFVEALRNYAQHTGQPIHSMNYHSFLEDKEDILNSNSVLTLNLFTIAETLEKDKAFKKSSLEGLPEKIDLIYSIRCHMEGLWQIHENFIKDHGSVVDEARLKIESYHKKYLGDRDESIVYLSAIKELKKKEIEKTFLFLGWEIARQELIKEMPSLSRLGKKYISNKVHGH